MKHCLFARPPSSLRDTGTDSTVGRETEHNPSREAWELGQLLVMCRMPASKGMALFLNRTTVNGPILGRANNSSVLDLHELTAGGSAFPAVPFTCLSNNRTTAQCHGCRVNGAGQARSAGFSSTFSLRP